MTMAAPTSKDSFAFGGEVYIIYGSSVGQLVVTLPFPAARPPIQRRNNCKCRGRARGVAGKLFQLRHVPPSPLKQ